MADMFDKVKSLQPSDVFAAPNDLPTLEVSASTDYMIFRAMDSVRNSLLYNKGRGDPTPYLMTMFLINTIPAPDWRKDTIQKFQEFRETNRIDDIGSPEIHTLCTLLVGVVTDWQAQYRRSVQNLVVGGV